MSYAEQHDAHPEKLQNGPLFCAVSTSSCFSTETKEQLHLFSELRTILKPPSTANVGNQCSKIQ